MSDLLKACIASGQVDSAQIEAHREAGELRPDPVQAAFDRAKYWSDQAARFARGEDDSLISKEVGDV